MSLLDSIQKENDIKKVPKERLPELAGEIRRFLIDSISKTGGHLASNLGAIELTMALHRCMSFPEDKLIFDVGHQSYTHKILTGRKDGFKSLRQLGGMSGFPKSSESDSDAFNTGHSSTSLSAAVGLAEARELRGSHEKVCAVIGDGSLTGGMAYEALDQMSMLNSNIVIILNDNEMSISRNVGSFSTSLSKFRVGKSYNKLKTGVENTLRKMPDVGDKISRGVKRSKDHLRNLIVPDTIFDEMGITYVGPLDGHDIESMTEIFEDAFKLNHPVLIHVKTKKGKGYKMAERYPEHFHGVGPFDPATGRALARKKEDSYTDVFSNTLLELGSRNDKIVAITAAMSGGTGIRAFQRQYPERTFDVGIAEQHAVTFAAGLAKGGYIPFFAVYSSFLQRGFDQILHDVCLQKLHVVFCLDRAGIVGEDGETHQGIYDTAYLSLMPGLTYIAPKGAKELATAMNYAAEAEGPVVIRYPKGNAFTELDHINDKFRLGRSEEVCPEVVCPENKQEAKTKSLAIFAVGSMVATAYHVRNAVEKETGYGPELINMRFIKPLDLEKIRQIIAKYDVVAVVEEAIESGSVGQSIGYEIVKMQESRPEFKHFCLKDDVVQHGKRNQLLELEGLGEHSICQELLKAIKK